MRIFLAKYFPCNVGSLKIKGTGSPVTFETSGKMDRSRLNKGCDWFLDFLRASLILYRNKLISSGKCQQ